MIRSVDRAIRVLTALQGARRLSVTEVADRVGLPASTTHGLLRTLLAHGLVVQDRGSGRYQLGPAVLRLGNVYLDTLELRSRAVPWAEDLARRTGCAVRAAVLLVDDVVVIHHEPRPGGGRQMPEIGIVIPVHASALGKAILAFAPDEADRVLAAPALRSMTGDTVTAPDALRRQLDRVRATGVAVEQDEAVLGESVIAAPVFDAWGDAAGAIGVVLPSDGVALEQHDALAAVRDTARAVSRELGAPSWPPPRPA